MIEIAELHWPEIQRVMYWYTGTVSDSETGDLIVDSLMALFVENRKATNADVGKHGEMMVRYDAETAEVIGLEIELFESDFLNRNPELANDWAAIKPEGIDGFHNSSWLTNPAATNFANHLKSLAHQAGQAANRTSTGRRDRLLFQKSDVPA